jgi:hypothetical protein
VVVLVTTAGCSATTPRVSMRRAATTTSHATTTTVAPTTTRSSTTTAAPTTTRAPTTTLAPTTTAPPPPTAAPTTTLGLHKYPDASFGCSSVNSPELTPVRAIPWNITATVFWSDGYQEKMSDNTPHKPPVTVTMVGSRGSRVTVQIFWDPTQPSYSIPPGPPGAWTCRLLSVV